MATSVLFLCGTWPAWAGQIRGRVTDEGGAPIPWIFLDLYDQNGAYFDYSYTDGTGNYAFINLGSGTFYVRTYTIGAYVDAWYDGVAGAAEDLQHDPFAAGATAIPVGLFEIVAGIHFTLVPGAAILGQVTDGGGAPISNAYVDAYLPDGDRFLSGVTETDGTYRVAGLPAGSYAVRTDTLGGYVDTWQDGTAAFDSVAPVDAGVPAISLVAGQEAAGVNFSLGEGAAVGGRIQHADGSPVSGVYVDLYGGGGGRLEFSRSVADGGFRLGGLPAGTYYLGTDSLGSYVDLWYDNRLMVTPGDPLQDQADALVLAPAEIRSNVIFHVDQGAEITGRVADGVGTPVTNALVDVYLGNVFLEFAQTETDGAFRVPALPDGTYHVKTDTLGAYLDEWYDDHTLLHADDPVADGADSLVVTNGISVTGLVFELSVGAEVLGTLTAFGGTPIPDGYLDLYDAGGSRLFYTRSNSNGTYRLGGLPTGTYYVCTDTRGQYVDEWYDDQVILSRTNPVGNQATALALAAESSLADVNLELRAGGSIAGMVTGTNDTPLVSCYVELYLGTNYFDLAVTDTNGLFAFSRLPAATYYLRTENTNDLVNEWYGDAYIFHAGLPEADGAAPVTLAADEHRAGVNIALGWGADLEGTVCAEGGSPLPDVFIDLFDFAGRYYDFAVTHPDGAYSMELLPPGTWYAGTDTFGDYLDEWYEDIPRDFYTDPLSDGATPLLLEDGYVLIGVDMLLALTPLNLVVLSASGGTNGTVLIEWMGEASQPYQVERILALRDGIWTAAPSGTLDIEQSYKPTGPPGLRQYMDPVPSGTGAYYRVTDP